MPTTRNKSVNFGSGDLDAKFRIQEIKQKKMDIIDTKIRLVIDEMYALKSLLIGSKPGESASPYISETPFVPIFDTDDQEIIRRKIMELVKKL